MITRQDIKYRRNNLRAIRRLIKKTAANIIYDGFKKGDMLLHVEPNGNWNFIFGKDVQYKYQFSAKTHKTSADVLETINQDISFCNMFIEKRIHL